MDISLESPGTPGAFFVSVYRRAPNRRQAPSLVKWSWRPFWGCRRCDKSRPPVRVPGGRGACLAAFNSQTGCIMAPRLRELIGLSLLAGLGFGLAFARGEGILVGVWRRLLTGDYL